MNIKELVEMYPNNMELGTKVRELYWKEREFQDKLMEEMKDKKIFESPDGGKTIYERPFGGDISERTLINEETRKSIFPDSVEYTDEYYKKQFINPYHPNK
jgi:glucose-6-phosphate 1-dehydrogenase